MTPCWLALATDDVEPEALQCLTTRIMAWGEGVWLFDLTPFLSYWQRQARAKRQDVLGLWRDILHHVFGGRRPGDRVVAMHVRFQAVFARHPAEALLLLHHMKARRLTGVVTTATEFGARLSEQLRWESFWAFADEVAAHGQRLKMRGWSGSWRAEWERGKRAILRLGANQPRDLRHIKPDAMQRRFGKRLGLLWEWCWCPSGGHPLQGFPWEDWQPGESVRVTRHLDHAVFSWQELAPWLRLDFDRLASLCGERRVAMVAWQLTLSNMEAVTISIGFRHPHRLREEAGEHTTALLQAEYAFQAFEMGRQEAVAEGGEIPPYPVSWDLSVTSMLTLPPVLRDLFQDVTDGRGDEDGLIQLENELPVPLVRFAWREDWVPEDSYQEGVAEAPEGPWRAAALRRPLFLYEKAQPLSGATRHAAFAETVMTKWWRAPSQTEGERQYFRLLSEKNDALWVYRDGKGQWWIHGVFG